MPPLLRSAYATLIDMMKPGAGEASATEFHSEDVTSPQRPVVTITIGDTDYTARCPKMRVWMDTGFLLELVEKANAAAKRLKEQPIMAAPEKRELQAVLAAAPDARTIHETMIDGSMADGVLRGGFLRRCLGEDSYRHLALALDDDESVVDMPEVYQASLALYLEFEPWFAAMASELGMNAPKARPTITRRPVVTDAAGAAPGTRTTRARKTGATRAPRATGRARKTGSR